ncbi:tRNA-uridine aminocarboxypropyltransferase [Planctomycetes bacterium K23_9]|uniref:tRNA-uridine aminocarboxypropyltransferase n=1 Tax=Stieleria marina TaxID=1930275 RepID=A0A517NT87_9BACT|nr:DTW domain protein [Planctomycetes bacterium K23_9]
MCRCFCPPTTDTPIPRSHEPAEPSHNERVRCYECYRPKSLCFCDQIPSVANQTEVLILQHMRERFHPFNTARILRKALVSAELLVDHNEPLGERLESRELSDRVGVLYPGPDGRLLSDLAPHERPDQLIVIDGTWHHAKTLVRDIPRLGQLPRYQIRPAEPGRYRIRREPNAMALSTLEATVAALKAIEPDTAGLDQLVAAFDAMVQTQLDHPKARYGWRANRRRSQNAMGIPRAILHDLPNVVVAYGESEPGKAGCKRSPRGSEKRQPVYWVAHRMGTGESFAQFIRPPEPLPQDFLQHVELSPDAWDSAVTPTEFAANWRSFLKPDDTVVTYHASTMRLLENVDALPPVNVVLKSVKFDDSGQHPTLDSYLKSQNLTAQATEHGGRGGQRLANGIALVQHLNQIGNSSSGK